MIPQMKTINEIARIFHLPRHYIRQLVWKKEVKYVKAGKKYLINSSDLIRYFNCENSTRIERSNYNEIF